jgi:hypothetical protein
MTIEGSFGILVNKWGVLQGPISLGISSDPVVIKDCMDLHNLIITDNLPKPEPLKPPSHSLGRDNRVSTRSWISVSLIDTEYVVESLHDSVGVTHYRHKIKDVMTQIV